MRPTAALVPAALALALTACAHAPSAAPAAPDYTPLRDDPAPAHARYYADCIAQAANSGAFRRAADGGDELILFTCTGAPARAFYEALGPWSARIGSAFEHDGRSYRSTARVEVDLFGVDLCSAASGADHRCVLSFNAGDFLDGE